MFADVARTEFGVDGTGETIGVLSTSVNQFNGGLAASYATGDLNPANPVNVIQDDPGEPTDEGRAMLENIHDIAPGANLQFATALISEVPVCNQHRGPAESRLEHHRRRRRLCRRADVPGRRSSLRPSIPSRQRE